MKMIILALSVLVLTACGGGGGGGGSEVNTPPPSESRFVGTYSGLADFDPIEITDFTLHGERLKNLYAGNTLLASDVQLVKVGEFQGNTYEFNDGMAAAYLDARKMHAAILFEADKIGVYQHSSLAGVEITRESINGEWSGFYYYEERGAVYQLAVTALCDGEICTLSSGDNELIIDFATEFQSDFKAESVWFGREANGGELIFSSASMTSDGRFMAMPMCWQSFAFDDEIFFDICHLAVLSRQ